MIQIDDFFNVLAEHKCHNFFGVPDSLLKSFCSSVDERARFHHICANEGAAIAMGMGHYMATKEASVIYLQNSGLGNTVNPLLSLADNDVYSIPLLMIIGWRGSPGTHDEPQHVKQGKITATMLDTMGIDYIIIDDNTNDDDAKINDLLHKMYQTSSPVAILVKKDSFNVLPKSTVAKPESTAMTREQAIEVIVAHDDKQSVFISTTGMASRELFEIRENAQESHQSDFLCVGGMGYASSIAFGIATAKPERNIICIDGDGAALMHMGTLSSIGTSQNKNFTHILINNGAHDSVGGQATVGQQISFVDIAKSLGYDYCQRVDSVDMLKQAIASSYKARQKPCFIEIIVKKGNRPNLGRPTTTPIENKHAFMEFLND